MRKTGGIFNMNGTKLCKLRKKYGYTQEALAELLKVSFQAVSAWERGEYDPDLNNIRKLSDIFNVSMDYMMNEIEFKTQDSIFGEEELTALITKKAEEKALSQTKVAFAFAKKAHEGQKRKRSEVPYFTHPLMVCAHAIHLGFEDDAMLSACLLHDVLEDCDVKEEELPVGMEARHLVVLLTRPEGKKNKEALEKYYLAVAGNEKAILIKCLDRCNNLMTMTWGLKRHKQIRYIRETEEHIYPLLKQLSEIPKYQSACWLLKYQMESMIDTIKRSI